MVLNLEKLEQNEGSSKYSRKDKIYNSNFFILSITLYWNMPHCAAGSI